MSADPRRRQKKLERKAAARRSKRQEILRAQSTGLGDQLRDATRYPVLQCLATDARTGVNWVLVSRQLPSGAVASTIFLVDRYCLGVKNVIMAVDSQFDYERRVAKMKQFTVKSIAPAYARKYVEGAVAYAAGFGLHPHHEYPTGSLIFGDIDASACPESFEYGKDGKPFFIAGPHDTPGRCRTIMNALARSCGAGNYDFLMPVGPGGSMLIQAASEDEIDDDDDD
jgi:hypothetical protein